MNRELLEQEIAGSKAALEAHKKGIIIHEIVTAAFEAELAKLPPKDEENTKKQD